MTDNMRIWDAVCETDPAMTKKVNQRGGFTAIAAQSQVMEATRQFGPVGVGWGYDTGEPILAGPHIIIPVKVWHSGDRNTAFGPEYGCAEIAGKRPDSDAPKKAVTDALTKLLSRLGFNADVFLGLFDDNKYVEQMQAKFNPPAPSINDAQIAEIQTLGQTAKADIKKFCEAYDIETIPDLPSDKFDHAVAALKRKIAQNAEAERPAA